MAKNLRLSQAVSVSGPGAIAHLGNECFVSYTIDKWEPPSNRSQRRYVPCRFPKLAKMLGIRELWQPTVDKIGDRGDVPESVVLMRFPQWMFCSLCGHMDKWSLQKEAELPADQEPLCQKSCCRGKNAPLIPMRWVRICKNGHMTDIDWNKMFPHKNGCRNEDPTELKFVSIPGKGTGFESMGIRCCACKETTDIRHYLQKMEYWECSGGQPWSTRAEREAQGCSEKMRVVQIGDTNVHFPESVSALDIPDAAISGTTPEQWVHWDKCLEAARTFEQMGMLDSFFDTYDRLDECVSETGLSKEEVCQRILEAVTGVEPVGNAQALTDSIDLTQQIKQDEFEPLSDPKRFFSAGIFVGQPYKPSEEDFGRELSSLIQSVSQIERLREVRAFRGFRRLDPSGESVKADPKSLNWLPAFETFGEGFFLKFEPKAVQSWEATLDPEVQQKIKQLKHILDEANLSRRFPEPNPGFLAIHTFSHVLMNQLSHECGYPTSSLRERIYNFQNSYGLLIYTASGDSEGTLGGLVRMSDPVSLANLIAKTLRSMSWCSADPICAESVGQGLSGLNEAACHACCLVPETSCEYANVLLNRKFSVGDYGLFSKVFAELEGVH